MYPILCGTGHDPPGKNAFSTVHKVKLHDILIVASNGMFDNLFMRHINYCLNTHWKSRRLDLSGAASCLATKAHDHSLNEDFYTPYAKKGRSAGFELKDGGKEDDITVIVA